MGVRVNVDFVCNEMTEHSLRFFKIKEGSNLLFTQQQDLSIEEAKVRLIDTLNGFTGDSVSVELYDVANDTLARGGKAYSKRSYIVKLPGGYSVNSKGGSDSSNDKLLREIFALQLQIQNINHENKLKELTSRIEEKQDPLNKLIEGLNPYLPQLLGLEGRAIVNGTNSAPGVATALAGPSLITKEDYQLRMKAALKLWAAADNDSLLIIESIANFANSNPDQYASYRTMILNLK